MAPKIFTKIFNYYHKIISQIALPKYFYTFFLTLLLRGNTLIADKDQPNLNSHSRQIITACPNSTSLFQNSVAIYCSSNRFGFMGVGQGFCFQIDLGFISYNLCVSNQIRVHIFKSIWVHFFYQFLCLQSVYGLYFKIELGLISLCVFISSLSLLLNYVIH